MREITCQQITETVARLSKEANFELPADVLAALQRAHDEEVSPVGKAILKELLDNAEIARTQRMPLCQDCGVAVIFLEVGQDVHVVGGDLHQAINAGVRQGYQEGYLRKSMVARPYSARVNTKDNTPALVHTDIVPGDKLKITILTKGGGCENMSRAVMLKPADGVEGIKRFVVETVDLAGSNPCPPTIVGVGVGGGLEMAAYLAKKAVTRAPLGTPSPDAENAALEKELFQKINALGIGPMGLGGRTTSLAVHVETFPAHIASLPVAVNIQCHAARQKTAVL